MVEKMRAFAGFTDIYLWSCGCNNANFTAVVNYNNKKTKAKSEIIKIQINERQI